MEIRTATKEDIPRIMQLREEFGHQMLYQTSRTLLEKYLDRILVAEENTSRVLDIVGYYHYIVSGDPGFEEMLRCYRQMPEKVIKEAWHYEEGYLCVVMQGGCHRDAFEAIIRYLQARYPEIWSWNSITNPDKPSGKIEGYKALGFTYNPEEKHTFFNVHKGDYSTYCLGRWKR